MGSSVDEVTRASSSVETSTEEVVLWGSVEVCVPSWTDSSVVDCVVVTEAVSSELDSPSVADAAVDVIEISGSVVVSISSEDPDPDSSSEPTAVSVLDSGVPVTLFSSDDPDPVTVSVLDSGVPVTLFSSEDPDPVTVSVLDSGVSVTSVSSDDPDPVTVSVLDSGVPVTLFSSEDPDPVTVSVLVSGVSVTPISSEDPDPVSSSEPRTVSVLDSTGFSDADSSVEGSLVVVRVGDPVDDVYSGSMGDSVNISSSDPDPSTYSVVETNTDSVPVSMLDSSPEPSSIVD